MDNYHLRGTGKYTRNPGDDAYPGEAFDDMYLERLRAEQYPLKSGKENLACEANKLFQLRAIGKLLTAPYRSLRGGLKNLFGRHNKHNRL